MAGAQEDITGQWYSEDSTRVYYISSRGDKYEGILEITKRDNENTGVLVLTDLRFNKKRKRYCGNIHAVSDGLTTRVKIRINRDRTILELRLARMLILPVKIKWYRKSAHFVH